MEQLTAQALGVGKGSLYQSILSIGWNHDQDGWTDAWMDGWINETMLFVDTADLLGDDEMDVTPSIKVECLHSQKCLHLVSRLSLSGI